MGALDGREERLVRYYETHAAGATYARTQEFAALVRRLAGRVEELERGFSMMDASGVFDSADMEDASDRVEWAQFVQGADIVRAALQSPTEAPKCITAIYDRDCQVHGCPLHDPAMRAPTAPREAADEDPRTERWIEESKRFTKQATAYGRSIAVRPDIGSSWQPEKERPLYGVHRTDLPTGKETPQTAGNVPSGNVSKKAGEIDTESTGAKCEHSKRWNEALGFYYCDRCGKRWRFDGMPIEGTTPTSEEKGE
jgi:hypothetical protein